MPRWQELGEIQVALVTIGFARTFLHPYFPLPMSQAVK